MKTLIRFSYLMSVVISLMCCENKAQAVIGATTPFVSYEAETGTLGGGATVVALTSPPTTEFSSPQLESSGHAYVHLGATGQNVQWSNNTGKAITALNVRYSIPDASGGGGINSTMDLYVNGSFRGAIAVNSHQTWRYESSSSYNGMSTNPASGSPHIFWDEVSFFVPGGAIPAGGTFSLQKDSANSAAYYNIDVVDLEAPPAALTQPGNSLSIVTYGAESNNPSFNSSTAIQNCINAAESQNKIVWIPSGTYYVLNGSTIYPSNNITIQGAGPWYSEIMTSKGSGDVLDCRSGPSGGASFKDFCMDSYGTLATPGVYAIAPKGANWVIDDIWCKHMTMVWGYGTNATIENCRVNNSWGDGMQLNNGEGQACTNVLIYNNFVRGSGDDAIAITSSVTNLPPVTTATVMNNTTVASWWANQMGVYGGKNIIVASNLFLDCVKKTGIELNSGFGALPPVGQVAKNNTLLRCGSFGYAQDQPGIIIEGGGTNTTVINNTITNSMFEGVKILSTWALNFKTNMIASPGTTGITISSGNSGSATFSYNIVQGLKSGQQEFVNNSGSFTTTQTGNSWQGAIFYQNTQYGGAAGLPLPVGTYTTAQLAAQGVPSLWASSVRIPPGRTVIMYSGDNFTGTSWTLTVDTADFTKLSPSANDQMSSCKVQ